MAEQIDVFTIKRSRSTAEVVRASVSYNDVDTGTLELPARAWVKLKRLLENGIAHDKREGNALKVKVKVVGLEEVPPLKTLPTPPERNILTLDDNDYDPDIAAAEQQARHDAAVEGRAATAEQLVKSLRGGGE